MADSRVVPTGQFQARLGDVAREIRRLKAFLFTPGPWDTWTPTFSGFTIGGAGAGVYAVFDRVRRNVHFELQVNLGAGATVSGWMIFTLPYTPAVWAGHNMTCWFYDNSTGKVYAGFPLQASTNQIAVSPLSGNDASGFVTWTGTDALTPFPWTAGDVFVCCGTYPALE